MVNAKYTLLFGLLFALSSCEYIPWNSSAPLAKVGSKTLYANDVQGIFAKNISASDSLTVLRNYVDTWVQKELLLLLAEEKLDSERKDVTELLYEYRSSLLVYRYEQAYIEQSLDTVVSSTEIEQFYNANRQSFKLSKPLVRVRFIKLKKNSSYLERIKKLYRSNTPDDITMLESFCLQAALRLDYFGDRWLSLEELMPELPFVENIEEQVAKNKHIEVSDNAYTYLIAIRDYRARHAIAPLEYESDNIKNMILSRRKQYMIEDLEKRVLRDAKHNETVKIFLADE
ncbi:MAG: hypothetical protein LBU92_06105 [Prevotellaceae bacterium]|jgi:hypothetical protein|nr:hypothetical protein [Prevotellaceae bacterium]